MGENMSATCALPTAATLFVVFLLAVSNAAPALQFSDTIVPEETEVEVALSNGVTTAKDCRPYKKGSHYHFMCTKNAKCYNGYTTYSCTCNNGYEGYTCDEGPPDDNFSKLPKQSQANTLIAAELADLAYYTPQTGVYKHCPEFKGKELTKVSFNNMKGYNDNDDIVGIYTHSGFKSGKPFISFRGTDNNKGSTNWIQDATFYTNFVKLKTSDPKWKGKTVRIHKGFDGGITKNWAALEKQIKDILGSKPKGNLLVTGHSLGGALATVFTLYVKDRFPDVKIDLISVAAPRSLDAEGARFIEGNTETCYRLVNANPANKWFGSGIKGYDRFAYDAVPQVPRASGTVSGYIYYTHPCEQITLGYKDGTQQLAKGDTTLKVQLHSMGLYVHRVKQLAAKVSGLLAANEICPKRFCAKCGNVKTEE